MTAPEPVTEKLLKLHLKHEMDAFTEGKLLDWLRFEVPLLFDRFRSVSLKQVISAESIKSTIKRNVVNREIPGAIVDIAGDVVTGIYTSDFHRKTRLSQIMSSEQFEAFADKIMELLKQQRKEGLNHLIDLPIYNKLISNVIYHAISRYIYDTNLLSKNVPGVSSILKFGKRVVYKTVPKLEGAVEESVKNYISRNLDFLLEISKSFLEESLTNKEIKTSAMNIWGLLENKTLGSIQQGAGSLNLGEFVVLGYKFWLHFRKTAYFLDCYEWVVDFLYDTYGDNNLKVLFEDFDITPDQIIEEITLFLPGMLQTVRDDGILEGILRRRLESFYQSTETNQYLNTVMKHRLDNKS